MIQWGVALGDEVLATYADEDKARAEWARFPEARTLLRREVSAWEDVTPETRVGKRR
jgi:hypothetical protein